MTVQPQWTTAQQQTAKALADAAIANPTIPMFRTAYYEYIASLGSPYARLAAGVPESTTPAGAAANEFLARSARTQENPVEVTPAISNQIGIDLVRLDYLMRYETRGVDGTYSMYRDIHKEAFEQHGIKIEAWTAYIPQAVLGDAAWNSILQNPLTGSANVFVLMTYHSRFLNSGALDWMANIIPTGWGMGMSLASDGLDEMARRISNLLGLSPTNLADPLFIDLDGNGVEFSALNERLAGVAPYLNTDGDNFSSRISWLKPGSGDAVLVWDRNGDGLIGNTEVIGLLSGDALAELRALDSDGNGVLDAGDEKFSELRAWKDADGNALSSPGEVVPLSSVGLASLNVSSVNHLNQPDFATGNITLFSLSALTTGGETKQVYDLLLNTSRVDTRYVGPLDMEAYADKVLAGRADLRGGGRVPDLLVQETLDPTLEPLANALLGLPGEDVPEVMARAPERTNAMLLRWTGSDSLHSMGRGEFTDARKLNAMEAFTTLNFSQGGNPNPNAAAGMALDSIWGDFLHYASWRMVLQGSAALELGVRHDLSADKLVFASLAGHPLTQSEFDQAISDVEGRIHAMAQEMTGYGSAINNLAARAGFWSSSAYLLRELALDNPPPGQFPNIFRPLVLDQALAPFTEALLNPIILSPGAYHHRPSGDAYIVTSAAGNVMSVGDGNRIVVGLDGDDLFRPGEGRNLIDLGGGTNTLTYDLLYTPMTIDMSSGIALRQSGLADHFTNVQKLTGSRAADAITGSENADFIVGIAGPGLETIRAGAGNDTVYGYDIINPWLGQGLVNIWGEDGNDIIIGTESANSLSGGAGDDVLYSLGGDDTMNGGAGRDLLDGGWSGTDVADYSNSPAGVRLDMALVWTPHGTGSMASDGWGDTDILLGIDSVVGSSHDDTFLAGQNSLTAWGGAGNDTYVMRAWSGQMSIVDRGGGDDLLLLVGPEFDPQSTTVHAYPTGGKTISFGSGLPSVDMAAGVERIGFQHHNVEWLL